MRRIISILFILIMVFSISVNAAMPIVPHSTVDELGQNEGMFEYYFENSETFEVLNKVLILYNEKFGYETDREIKMGEGENEITAAIFDEEKIIIYCKDIEESGIKMSLQSKHLRFLLEPFVKNKELKDDLHSFVDLLSNISPALSSLILPIVIEYTPGPNKPYSPYMNVLEIISIIIGYLSICYLLYILIYVLYCLIKKKKLQRIKSKVVLSLLALFYLLMNGLNGIINCIFIIINSF